MGLLPHSIWSEILATVFSDTGNFQISTRRGEKNKQTKQWSYFVVKGNNGTKAALKNIYCNCIL